MISSGSRAITASMSTAAAFSGKSEKMFSAPQTSSTSLMIWVPPTVNSGRSWIWTNARMGGLGARARCARSVSNSSATVSAVVEVPSRVPIARICTGISSRRSASKSSTRSPNDSSCSSIGAGLPLGHASTISGSIARTRSTSIRNASPTRGISSASFG